MADPQKVEAGQVWYDRKTGEPRIVCDVGHSTVHWRTSTGKRRAVGKYLPHWLVDMSPTPVEPKKPDPRDAVIEAARKACDRWKHREVPLYSELDTLLAALTALDAAKGST